MTSEPDNVMILLGRIDGKLDSALGRLDGHDDTLEKHEERISALEKDRAKVVGAAVVVSAILGSVIQWFTK